MGVGSRPPVPLPSGSANDYYYKMTGKDKMTSLAFYHFTGSCSGFKQFDTDVNDKERRSDCADSLFHKQLEYVLLKLRFIL